MKDDDQGSMIAINSENYDDVMDTLANVLTHRMQDFLDQLSQGRSFDFQTEEKAIRDLLDDYLIE